MASLLVVRHGRTAANASGRLLGREDPPLDEVGSVQAAAAARAVAAWAGERAPLVVSSPLLRTRQTAAAIAEALGRDSAVASAVDVQVDERLVELDYGELEGTPTSEVPASTWASWQADLDFRPPGGESLAELGRRVRRACADWALQASTGEPVVLVSHVSPIKAAVAWALGVGDEISWRTYLDTASISEIGVRGTRAVLVRFNDTAHLHDPGASRR